MILYEITEPFWEMCIGEHAHTCIGYGCSAAYVHHVQCFAVLGAAALGMFAVDRAHPAFVTEQINWRGSTRTLQVLSTCSEGSTIPVCLLVSVPGPGVSTCSRLVTGGGGQRNTFPC